MIDERLKDKFYRLQHLYRIRTKDRESKLFKFNRVQRTILREIEDCLDEKGKIIKPLRHFTLKYRQGGVSTFWLLWWLDETIFHKNTFTGVLSHERESLGYLWEIVRFAHASMPESLRPSLGDDSKTSLSFPDLGSKIFVSLGIRSTTVHNLHISEWCFIKDEEIYASKGAASPTSNMTGETTGNGIGNDGYAVYTEAKEGRSDWKSLFVPWFIQEEYVIPHEGKALVRTEEEKKLDAMARRDYDTSLSDDQIMFRRMKKKELRHLFPQEYPEIDADSFITTGDNFFDNRKIMALMRESRGEEPEDKSDDWVMWERPTPGKRYVMGADVAEGGGDYSVIACFNVTDRKQSFRYRARVGLDKFYRECDHWARKYNNALLAVERNNHGHAVLLGLREMCRYPNLYREQKNKRFGSIIKKPGVSQEFKYGWETTALTRPLMLDQLKMALEGDYDDDEDHFQPEFSVLDGEMLSECLSFARASGTKYEASDGHHDDCVMAWAIAFQMYLKSGRSGRSSPGKIIAAKKRFYS